MMMMLTPLLIAIVASISSTAASPVAKAACPGVVDWTPDRTWVELNIPIDDGSTTFYNCTILGMKANCAAGATKFVWNLVDKTDCATITPAKPYAAAFLYEDIAVYVDSENRAVDGVLSQSPGPLGGTCEDGAQIYARALWGRDMTASDAPKTGWTVSFE